jgi:hypothetical protein
MRKGLFVDSPQSFNRTEGGICYHYPLAIQKLYDGWAANRRVFDKPYSFKDFFNQLPDDRRGEVTVTQLKNKKPF